MAYWASVNSRYPSPSQAADKQVQESEARSRELYECNQRLEAHIRELETRKRAPLYQVWGVRMKLTVATRCGMWG